MYPTSHTSIPASASVNGMGGTMVDGTGTINPAALNTSVPASSSISSSLTPRGQKRSRSPEDSEEHYGGAEDDESKPKKRGRPPKTKEEDAVQNPQPLSKNETDHLTTPQATTSTSPLETNKPSDQVSPPKATPTKATVVKALPTVRDHTTDQLTPEGDEYIPREYDENGEKKVLPTGEPLGGRQFKMRSFYVANRGNKRFMLATECARVLNYRDSYLLFNKNRSLYKIIATQAEKDELIHQEILPYSYRSRQIAIVTAKSMFRQFGARIIEGGRRVRDDYWESKALKQGFTENDLAGDKRPGASKARETNPSLEHANAIPPPYGQTQDIIYTHATMQSPHHPDGLQFSSINSFKTEDSRQTAYSGVPRPRQEMTGAPYQDRTQPSPATDVLHQASNAAELNKQLAQQRGPRNKYLDEAWNREHKPPVSSPHQKSDLSPPVSQSPQLPASANPNQQYHLQSPHAYSLPSYSHQNPNHHSQHPHTQSPSVRHAMRPELSQSHRSSVSYQPSQQHGSQTSPYGFSQQGQVWGHPPPHPQQSPVSSHHPGLPTYSPSQHSSQPSLHQSQHSSQSPHAQPSQLHHSQSGGNLHSGYQQQLAAMPSGGDPSFSNPPMGSGRALYPPPQSASPSHYMQQQAASTGAPQGGMQGWSAPPAQSGWGGGGQGGYPSSSQY